MDIELFCNEKLDKQFINKDDEEKLKTELESKGYVVGKATQISNELIDDDVFNERRLKDIKLININDEDAMRQAGYVKIDKIIKYINKQIINIGQKYYTKHYTPKAWCRYNINEELYKVLEFLESDNE